MINDNRIQLNNRFVEVFSLLQNRGDILLNDRSGKGMGDFAEKILGKKSYGHIVRAFLNPSDKRVIDYHHIETLCKTYGVNEAYMLHGMGMPFGINLPASDVSLESDTTGKANILFTSVEAFAGPAIAADSFSRESNTFFSIPGLTGGNMVAFPVNGNSMSPILANNDIVVCKALSGVEEIRDNDIYAIKTQTAVWVKYVQKIYSRSKNKHVTHLKLISANYLEHDPFEEAVDTHTYLYKVIRKISDM